MVVFARLAIQKLSSMQYVSNIFVVDKRWIKIDFIKSRYIRKWIGIVLSWCERAREMESVVYLNSSNCSVLYQNKRLNEWVNGVRSLDSITNRSSPENEWSVCVMARRVSKTAKRSERTITADRNTRMENPFYYVDFMSMTVCVRSIKSKCARANELWWQKSRPIRWEWGSDGGYSERERERQSIHNNLHRH